MSRPQVAIITAVAGRHEHFVAQWHALTRSRTPYQHRVVVAMSPLPPEASVMEHTLVELGPAKHLPLARARNLGARAALDAGAELLIFLDVDCLPSPQMIGRYVEASAMLSDDLLCGPVEYLPANSSGSTKIALPKRPMGHPARPTPDPGELIRGGDHRLFWSLSFAIRARQWKRVGGFDERFEGYGAEDTDFGQAARCRGVELTWVGDAWAFHQHHPTSDPPVQHLEDIVRNATLFHRKWGWWPMSGWLTEFARLGLVQWDMTTKELSVRSHTASVIPAPPVRRVEGK